ncbi:CsgG/HfaB family protein [Burkholderia contaminans]|uniref:CsgG/HfaB family protein n=1 Tax=Burkholderia cepacia complex TaxID=87882 RepID=UPI0026516931|nr:MULTISPECIES: CsgG/HfaB family protein [Burkholderia cepacia complex]MDN7577382.1 CsgG/HfaB family protein [Burkholderia contaminans]MDN7670773.1 CsgG/HfaB family protein [Burkholderia vietnamiensis]
MRKTLFTLAAVLFATSLAACSDMQLMGGGKSPDSTAVAGSNAPTADSMHHCSTPLGTLAVYEDQQSPWYQLLTRQYQLPSTVPVLKLLIQQSNCFVIVDRGNALDTAIGERALGAAGEIRATSRIKKGRMVAADYTMTPSITFSNQNAGSLGGVLSMIPVVGNYAAQVAGQINTKSASTTLTLVDNRSTVQVAAATGSARNMDIGALGSIMSTHTGGTIAGYSDTPEGKVIVAAFTDSLNNLVDSLKQYKTQHVKGGLGNGGRLKVD